VVVEGARRMDANLVFLTAAFVQGMVQDARKKAVRQLVVAVDYVESMEVENDVLLKGVILAHNLEDCA